MSQFFEILILSHIFFGNIHYVCEINLIFLWNLIKVFYCPSEKIFKKSRHNFVEETLLKMICQHKHFTFSRLNISRLCSSKLVRFFKNFSEKSTFIMFCKKINTAKQSEIVLQRNSFFFLWLHLWLLFLMATLFVMV